MKKKQQNNKTQSNNALKKMKEKDELESVKVDVVTSFIKDVVVRSSDTEVYNNDDASEKNRVNEIKYNAYD